jgi:dTMP kinase
LTELFLVSAARCQHVQLFLLPELKLGRWILCDRFYDSSYIYQGVLGGIDRTVIDKMTDLASYGLVPELTFLLDCDVDIAFQRMEQRHQQDGAGRYDAASREIRQKMREGYLHLAQTNKNRMVVLNANLELPLIVSEAIAHIESRRTRP